MNTSSSPSILLVTEDQGFFSQCQKELRERFDIEIFHYSEDNLFQVHLSLHPCLILWDSRSYSKDWRYLVSWLRDHFSGIPIMVVTRGDGDELLDYLQRQGIHTHLDIESPSFFKSLQVHVFAVLLDLEKKNAKPISYKVS